MSKQTRAVSGSRPESLAPNLLQTLAQAPAGARHHILLTALREQACEVLGLAPDDLIHPEQPLSELGLDSLMAVELRNRISTLLAQPLPATLVYDQPALAALTTYLAHELWGTAGAAQPANLSPMLAEVANLSDEEAEALLLAELDSLNQRGNGSR